MGMSLALDTILSATFHFVTKWSPELKRNQSRDLLRFLVCKLYDQGRGELGNAQITLAQGTLARKLGLSRTWVNILVGRLKEAGWIDYYAPALLDGTRASSIFRVGNTLKRLLVMLAKAKPKKTRAKHPVKEAWQFSPTPVEKKILSLLAKENEPPKPHLLAKVPLLGRWLERGKDQKRNSPKVSPGAVLLTS
jgi:hypothetical protein